MAIPAGCNRAHYRRQADREVYGLIRRGSTDPRWPLPGYTVQPDPRSRFFDPDVPDCPPMPPDDPTSHQLMHYVDGKRAWPWEAAYGRTSYVDNPAWKRYLPVDENGVVVLDRQGAVQLALMHSPEYQKRFEDLYLSALGVTFERFQFDTQFFGGNSTFFTADGPARGNRSSSRLNTDTDLSMRRAFATGGNLVVGVANSLVWQFSGPDDYSGFTLLDFALVQPLLRAAGRAVVLEDLTSAERQLLADIRQLERFRREFYIQTIAGEGLRAGALLGLLRDEVQIRNTERNVVSLQDSLRQLEAAYEAGQESLQSVELTRQNLFGTQSGLLASRANYETSLDGYIVRLGLPPDLEVRIEDPLLERFNLIAPAMTATQDAVDAFADELRDPDQPMPADHRVRTAAIRQECEAQLEAVRKDLELLLEALPRRREALAKLSAREEFRRGDVDPVVGSVAGLHQRVVRWNVDFYGERHPSVEQLAGDLLTTAEGQEWFNEYRQKLREADIAGAAAELTATLAQLEAFERDPAAATAAVNAELAEGAVPKTPKEVLAALGTRLSRQLLGLSLVQARARLDAITLVPIELSPEEAYPIAQANRRDWMNARADLVDTWRQIEMAANDLQSDLDVTFGGEMSTTKEDPFRFRGTTGRLRVGLEFDAPLTRLAERNAYRRVLIAYQQARRDYYAFEDGVNQSLRSLLRTIRLDQLDFEISRGSVFIAITRVDQARRELERPPGVGQAGARGGVAATRELVDSLNRLLTEQNRFAGAWADYEARRMQLDLDLGTMELDERGTWIDPGPIEGGQFGLPGAPQPIPPGPQLLPRPDLPTPPGAEPGQQPAIRILPEVYDADPRPRRFTFDDHSASGRPYPPPAHPRRRLSEAAYDGRIQAAGWTSPLLRPE